MPAFLATAVEFPLQRALPQALQVALVVSQFLQRPLDWLLFEGRTRRRGETPSVTSRTASAQTMEPQSSFQIAFPNGNIVSPLTRAESTDVLPMRNIGVFIRR